MTGGPVSPRDGSVPDGGSPGGASMEKAFYPDYLFEVLVVVVLTVELIVACALLWPPSTGHPVNFSARYDPRPEWYFLWLYQLVRYFSGPYVAVGTVGVPLAALGLLTLLPFLDGKDRRGGRALAIGIAAALFLGVLALTVAAL